MHGSDLGDFLVWERGEEKGERRKEEQGRGKREKEKEKSLFTSCSTLGLSALSTLLIAK